MAKKPHEYIIPEGRCTTNSIEGFHGLALKYRGKRVDLHHNHCTCKTNMAICHKVIVPYSGKILRTINFPVLEDFTTASKINSSKSSKSYSSIESSICEIYCGGITLKIFCLENYPLYNIITRTYLDGLTFRILVQCGKFSASGKWAWISLNLQCVPS